MKKVLFPASVLARKGAYEIRKLALEFGFELVITGRVIEGPDFLKGVNYQFAGNDVLDQVGLVILPAYVEHQPRIALKALGKGIPVIASGACGLKSHSNLTVIKEGDYETLKKAFLLVVSADLRLPRNSEA